MVVTKHLFLSVWLAGLAIFAVSLFLHAPLAIEAVPGGILDHQAAPDAASVDRIQSAWKEAGLLTQARTAMISDLVFIGVYGVGCVLGGLYFARQTGMVRRALGWAALLAGIVFLVSDYAETLVQVTQLTRFRGDDALAGFASSMGAAKVLSFLLAFGVLVIALAVDLFSRKGQS